MHASCSACEVASWIAMHANAFVHEQVRAHGVIPAAAAALPPCDRELVEWKFPYYPWDPPEAPLPVATLNSVAHATSTRSVACLRCSL